MNVIKLTFLILTLTLASCQKNKYDNLEDGLYADIQTDKGDILLKLEYVNTPVTVANFVTLAEGTNTYVEEKYKEKKFYDGLKFHRVVEDFMIQGGDPRGNGSGDPGYKFEDEFPMDDDGNLMLSHDGAGMLSMANSGPDSNGSQFFITHKETPFLNGRHTIFGHLIQGQSVVDSIKMGDVINKIDILRVGREVDNFDAKAVFDSYFSEIEDRKKMQQEKMKKVKEDLLQLIEDNKENIITLPSGLKYFPLKKGAEVKPDVGSKVLVYYAGYFTTGDLFDTNILETAKLYDKYDRRRESGGGYKPVPWDYSPDASLIGGFKEGMQQMNIGDKLLLIIPSHLAYGEQGSRGVIPPNADLFFELEIVDQVK